MYGHSFTYLYIYTYIHIHIYIYVFISVYLYHSISIYKDSPGYIPPLSRNYRWITLKPRSSLETGPYIHIYIFTYIYIYSIYLYIYTSVYLFISIYLSIYLPIYLSIYVHIRVYIYHSYINIHRGMIHCVSHIACRLGHSKGPASRSVKPPGSWLNKEWGDYWCFTNNKWTINARWKWWIPSTMVYNFGVLPLTHEEM